MPSVVKQVNIERKVFKYYGALLFALLILLPACDRGPNDPGWDYFPDMVYSPAYPTWSENPVLQGKMTMQSPVEGTIPRHMVPFQYEKTEEDLVRAGKELINPLKPSTQTLERGKKVYISYCANCHGVKGDGAGYLYTSGRYPFPPASLLDTKIREMPDGGVYHVISLGFGIMAAHGSIVLPEDRWMAIHYIRQEVQTKTD